MCRIRDDTQHVVQSFIRDSSLKHESFQFVSREFVRTLFLHCIEIVSTSQLKTATTIGQFMISMAVNQKKGKKSPETHLHKMLLLWTSPTSCLFEESTEISGPSPRNKQLVGKYIDSS